MYLHWWNSVLREFSVGFFEMDFRMSVLGFPLVCTPGKAGLVNQGCLPWGSVSFDLFESQSKILATNPELAFGVESGLRLQEIRLVLVSGWVGNPQALPLVAYHQSPEQTFLPTFPTLVKKSFCPPAYLFDCNADLNFSTLWANTRGSLNSPS